MTILQEIKARQLSSRKARDSVTALSLTTLIGEAETLAKASGHETQDLGMVVLLKKFIKNNLETQSALNSQDKSTGAWRDALDKLDAAIKEQKLFESFLPQQMDADQLENTIVDIISGGAGDIGSVMRELKTKYGGLYDGAVASKLLKEKFK